MQCAVYDCAVSYKQNKIMLSDNNSLILGAIKIIFDNCIYCIKWQKHEGYKTDFSFDSFHDSVN